MLKIEAGSVYDVIHKWEGNFRLAVLFADETLTTGIVIEGNADAFLVLGEIPEGERVTVKNSFCIFEKFETKKGVSMNFICTFVFQSMVLKVEADKLGKLKDGFLLDNQNRLTEYPDRARYWIAPSQISYIKIEGN